MVEPLTDALSSQTEWDSIDWIQISKTVKRLQRRIAKAAKDQNWGKVKSLQWLLTHSRSAKLLAVKKVTSSRGKNTAGVDGVIWRTTEQKLAGVDTLKRRGYRPKPLRRIYIPKSNGQMRPLGIPCIDDRAHQALHFLALEPVSEAGADRNAYGFRSYRSTADAVAQCFNVLSRKSSAKWVLEGDIKACFDQIDHDWLLKSIPIDTLTLKKWLRCGYMDKGVLFNTHAGTPQGGVISPTLMVMTLQGFEQCVKAVCKRCEKVHVVIYADDFVVTASSKEVLENKVRPAIERFLKTRGLRLSQEKTTITSIDKGFDFLGFNIRKYKEKLLIKPAKSNCLKLLRSLAKVLRGLRAESAVTVIRVLNPKIRGWANYYRHVVSSQIYSAISHRLFWMTWRWARRRHPNKNAAWVKRKYYTTLGKNNWVFFGHDCSKKQLLYLFSPTTISIKRHVKIKSDANPYDPAFAAYFWNRSRHGSASPSSSVIEKVLA